MPACVVTGTSSGIGEAIATDLIRHGWRVFGTIRSEADAQRLEASLGKQFTPLPADVTDPISLKEAAEYVAEALSGETLMGLVCNSGISLPGPLLCQPLEEFDRMWAVNVRGLIATIQAFAPLMGASTDHKGKTGRIISMSSVSGKISYPFFGGYAASKHAIEALSDALRTELMPFGLDVITINPGPIATPMWNKAAHAVDHSRYTDTRYGPLMARVEREVAKRTNTALPPQQVAHIVTEALTTSKPKASYAITSTPLKNWYLPRLLPKRLLSSLIARELGLKEPRS